MNTFQCRNYIYLFMGFTVEPFDDVRILFIAIKSIK